MLSRWFKQRFGKPVSQSASSPVNPLTGKPANLSQLIDSSDLTGITSKEPWSKETYFNEYKKSFAQGEYNLKETVTTPTGQVIRSYVSGGTWFKKMSFGTLLPLAEMPNSHPELSLVPFLIIAGAVLAMSVGFMFWSSWEKYQRDRKITLVNREEMKKLGGIVGELWSNGFDDNWMQRLVKKLNERKLGVPGEKGAMLYYLEEQDILITAYNDNYYTITLFTSPPRTRHKVLIYSPNRIGLGVDYFSLSIKPDLLDKLKGLGDSFGVEPSPGSSPLTLDQAKNAIKQELEQGNFLYELQLRSPEENQKDYVKGIVEEMVKVVDGITREDELEKLVNTLWEQDNLLPALRNAFQGFRTSSDERGLEWEEEKITRERRKTVNYEIDSLKGRTLAIIKGWASSSLTLEQVAIVAAKRMLGSQDLELEVSYPGEEVKTVVIINDRNKDIPLEIYYPEEGVSLLADEFASPLIALLKKEITEEEAEHRIWKIVIEVGHPSYRSQTRLAYLTTDSAKLLIKWAQDLLQKSQEKSQASSTVVKQSPAGEVIKRGGIDFILDDIEKYIHYDGGFKGIDLSLPLLSKKELESLDLDKEEEIVRNYLATGYNPHGDRLKRLLAGLFQKDKFTSKQLDLLRLSQKLCDFLSARGLETTPDQRAFILITDTGLFLKQGAGKAVIKPSLN